MCVWEAWWAQAFIREQPGYECPAWKEGGEEKGLWGKADGHLDFPSPWATSAEEAPFGTWCPCSNSKDERIIRLEAETYYVVNLWKWTVLVVQCKSGRSLSIGCYLTGDCHPACDWLQKDKNHTPFYPVSAGDNFFFLRVFHYNYIFSWQSAIVCWKDVDQNISAWWFSFLFFRKSESSPMIFIYLFIYLKSYHLWTWGAMTTLSHYPLLALLSGHSMSCTMLPCAVTMQDHTCCSSCLVGSISGDCNSALCSFLPHAECLVWKALHEQPPLKSANILAKIKSSIFVTFWLSESNLKTLLQWGRIGLA